MRQVAAIPILLAVAFVPASPAGTTADYAPSDAERARWTMADMRTLATAIEAYRLDNGAAPAVGTLEELRGLIEPIYVRKAPMLDAWGTGFKYIPPGEGTGYRIVSAGADRAFDPAGWSGEGESDGFTDDAVLTDGKMTRSWPYR